MSVQTLYTAATGMEAMETKLDVIANNLANVNTTGFKRGRAVFEDLLYEQVRQVGGSTSEDTEAPTGLALGSGVGFAALAESLDDSVRGSKSVAMALGAAPLAAIPYLENEREVSRRKRRLATKVTAAAAAIILAIAMLHYFWTPLDVLWYKALRKADVVINT